MTKDDGKRFNDAMTRMALIFPDRTKVGPDGKVKADVISLYWSALRPYSIEQVEGAMQQIQNTQTESFFPVPGRVVDAIKTHFPNKYTYAYPEADNMPPNERGAAYFLYCTKLNQEWNWKEYDRFKVDWAAGRVRVERVERVESRRGRAGRPDVAGSTRIIWDKSDFSCVTD